jgi:hypothetical protein
LFLSGNAKVEKVDAVFLGSALQISRSSDYVSKAARNFKERDFCGK